MGQAGHNHAGHPKVGEPYYQEYYEGEAEDKARALKLDGSAKVPYGSFDNVLEAAVKRPQERLKLVDAKHG